jgi:hypothetical protein
VTHGEGVAGVVTTPSGSALRVRFGSTSFAGKLANGADAAALQMALADAQRGGEAACSGCVLSRISRDRARRTARRTSRSLLGWLGHEMFACVSLHISMLLLALFASQKNPGANLSFPFPIHF